MYIKTTATTSSQRKPSIFHTFIGFKKRFKQKMKKRKVVILLTREKDTTRRIKKGCKPDTWLLYHHFLLVSNKSYSTTSDFGGSTKDDKYVRCAWEEGCMRICLHKTHPLLVHIVIFIIFFFFSHKHAQLCGIFIFIIIFFFCGNLGVLLWANDWVTTLWHGKS